MLKIFTHKNTFRFSNNFPFFYITMGKFSVLLKYLHTKTHFSHNFRVFYITMGKFSVLFIIPFLTSFNSILSFIPCKWGKVRQINCKKYRQWMLLMKRGTCVTGTKTFPNFSKSSTSLYAKPFTQRNPQSIQQFKVKYCNTHI
jgi:hypothetical protein